MSPIIKTHVSNQYFSIYCSLAPNKPKFCLLLEQINFFSFNYDPSNCKFCTKFEKPDIRYNKCVSLQKIMSTSGFLVLGNNVVCGPWIHLPKRKIAPVFETKVLL